MKLLKGTLIQIWKSRNIFVFTWRYYAEDFTLTELLRFEISAREICEKFVYKDSEIILLRNLQTSRVNNSIILRIKKAKFSGYYYLNICISVPLKYVDFVRKVFVWIHLVRNNIFRISIFYGLIYYTLIIHSFVYDI